MTKKAYFQAFLIFSICISSSIYADDITINAGSSERTFGEMNATFLVAALAGAAGTIKGLIEGKSYSANCARLTGASAGALLINTCYTHNEELLRQSKSFYAGIGLLFITICSCLNITKTKNERDKHV